MPNLDGETLAKRLPAVRGRLEANAPLADLTWFRAGGAAEVLFTPLDEADLADFLRAAPKDIPVYVIGVGSNLLVRDGGVPGVVIRLGRGFSDIKVEADNRVRVGTAVLDVRVARSVRISTVSCQFGRSDSANASPGPTCSACTT